MSIHEIGLSSLVYVSRSAMPLERDAGRVQAIVTAAHAKNDVLKITGALIYTELYFAQILEGPRRAIEGLIEKIRVDARHRDVTIVSTNVISSRDFSSWAMMNLGLSPRLDRYIKPLISPAATPSSRGQSLERLLAFMKAQAGGGDLNDLET